MLSEAGYRGGPLLVTFIANIRQKKSLIKLPESLRSFPDHTFELLTFFYTITPAGGTHLKLELTVVSIFHCCEIW